jgi:hypothetical protein
MPSSCINDELLEQFDLSRCALKASDTGSRSAPTFRPAVIAEMPFARRSGTGCLRETSAFPRRCNARYQSVQALAAATGTRWRVTGGDQEFDFLVAFRTMITIERHVCVSRSACSAVVSPKPIKQEADQYGTVEICRTLGQSRRKHGSPVARSANSKLTSDGVFDCHSCGRVMLMPTQADQEIAQCLLR